MYQDPLIMRAVERARRWREDRAVAQAGSELDGCYRYQDNLDDRDAAEQPAVIRAVDAAEQRLGSVARKRRQRREQLQREHTRCDLLAGAWQRLLSHDCLACTPEAPETCPAYLGLNSDVDHLASQVAAWRVRRVFHRLERPRLTWRHNERRWA